MMAAIFNKTPLIYLCLLTAFCVISVCYSARLSDPKILLPYHSSVVTNFTLSINLSRDESKLPDSCYTWHSTSQEVAAVQLVNSTDGECAYSAVISAVSKSPYRKTSIVIAENKVTGEILRCIVIVESIHRFEIETTTRLLYLEDSPEELIIKGYDEEGNVFSSLAGLEFEWTILPDTSAQGDEVVDILRIIKFMESHYTMPPHIQQLEARGLQGDTILVEGLRTGSALVKARARDLAYKTVHHPQVRIMVVANLLIHPAEAYVLKFGVIKYRVQLIKQNSIIDINMPSNQFFLEVQDKSICSLNPKSSVARALDLGTTEILLMDKNLKQDALIKPSAMLYVVSASYLGFVVLPHKSWVLERGREYNILIDVYDKDSHRIYPSDNVMLKATFPSEFFDIRFSSKNGTYHTVFTLNKGKTSIEGVLSTIIKEDGSEFPVTPVVKGTRVVEIFDPIVVQPDFLMFPWDPDTPATHQFQLRATGGSGDYVWSSSNVQTANVNIKGEINTGNEGSATVTASDTKNRAHMGTAEIHVLPPKEMKFVPKKVEAPVGAYLDVPLAVYGEFNGKLFVFNDCRNMRLNVSFSDNASFKYMEGLSVIPDGGCRVLQFKALQRGHTEVSVSYRVRGVELVTAVTIAAYDPLLPIDPEKESVIAVGSLKELVFRGGPQPWIIDSSKYFQILTGEKLSIINMEQVKTVGNNRGYHNFYVICKDYGEQTLTLKVGNDKTASNQYPAVEEASVSFNCANPKGLQLQPDVRYPENLPPCPIIKEHTQPVPVHCRRNLDILVTLTDAYGKKFDNFSSLEIDWSISDPSLGSMADSDNPSIQVTTSLTKDDLKTVRYFRTLNPSGQSGYIIITASIGRYSDRHLRYAGVDLYNLGKNCVGDMLCGSKISPKITKSLELKLVEESVITPDIISLFNHPSNEVHLDVQKGSGFFHVVPEEKGVVSLQYDQNNQRIQLSPISDGSLTVTVYDLCMYTPLPPTAMVYVSGVGNVELYVTEKVEVDNEVTARVKVMDAHGKPLQASFFPLMGLRLIPASSIVTVRPDKRKTEDLYTAYYTVYGTQVGHTSLIAEAKPRKNVVVRSHSKPVEVFPPLQLIPRNITMVIGALFQVLSKGGPTPQCTVLFSIQDRNIAEVSSSGLLDATNLGVTRVLGQAIGQDSETGETIIYSQDEVTVNVISLSGVRIHGALTRMQTGTEMPLYAVGLTEHETPFTFGTAVPSLSFTWSINNKDIIRLRNVFHKSNVQHSDQSNFATQLVAMTPGQVTVRLQVTSQRGPKPQIQSVTLSDELQVEVFEKLAVVSPSVCDGKILMSPHTEAVIKTNSTNLILRAGSCLVDRGRSVDQARPEDHPLSTQCDPALRIKDGSAKVSYTVISTDEPPVVTVGDGGLLTTNSATGQAALHITSQEEFGTNQTLVILIKVKPVSYLMINSDTSLRTSNSLLKTLPVGMTMQLTITYHDDVGEKFYATNVQMRYRCSRYDLVHVSHGLENSTLILKAAEVGQTILKVWDKNNPWLADYINIPVDYIISPSRVIVSLGEVVCFHTHLISQKGYSGSWYGSNKVVEVDKRSGIATATAVGHSLVVYNLTSDISTYTEITVQPIKQLVIDTSQHFLTTSSGTDVITYSIGVVIDTETEVHGNNCTGQVMEEGYQPSTIPFRCELQLTNSQAGITAADLFNVSPEFDMKNGRYHCLVTGVIATSTLEQQISTFTSDVIMNIYIPAQEGQPAIAAKPKTFPFLPPFYVHSTDVILTTLAPLSSVRVSTIPQLAAFIKVAVSDDTILESLTPEVDSQTGNILIYPIRLLETTALWEREKLDASIELSCLKTGQKVILPVSIRLIGQRPDYLDHPYLISSYLFHYHMKCITELGYRARGCIIYNNGTESSRGQVGWATFFRNIFNNYQSWLFILFLIIVTAIAVLTGYHTLLGPRYRAGTTAASSAFIGPAGAATPPPHQYSPGTFSGYSPPPYSPMTPMTGKSPNLWSVGYNPTEGSTSPRRRSPYQRMSPM